jgi:hypothetical protein
MPRDLKSRTRLAAVVVLALAAGYVLGRPGPRDGDMLDAVAAVQRRSPKFLVSEPSPLANWARSGSVYLCRSARTATEVDGLAKHPWTPDPRWTGVVCFRATVDRKGLYVPWIAEGGDRCLVYAEFAVFGDAQLLREVHAILADEGFHPAPDR